MFDFRELFDLKQSLRCVKTHANVITPAKNVETMLGGRKRNDRDAFCTAFFGHVAQLFRNAKICLCSIRCEYCIECLLVEIPRDLAIDDPALGEAL